MQKPPVIAICGIRGVPACYGGFETFAEELGSRLVANGHRVIVYGRKHFIKDAPSEYRGMELRLLPAPRHKYLETPVHSLLCFLDLICRRVDAVLVCNAANSPFIWILRLFRIPVAVNVDGIERKRSKWNCLGKAWYRLGEVCSVLFATEVVSDAQVIHDYYLENYKCESTVIAYGHVAADAGVLSEKLSGIVLTPKSEHFETLAKFEIQAGDYILYVSRLEPENNAHVVIQAYNALPDDAHSIPLVIVGDAPYATEYKEMLRRIAGESVTAAGRKRVIFTGFQFGQIYYLMQTYARLYVQASEVGGTHPALVESMGFANAIIANDTPENREVLSDTGVFYEKNSSLGLTKCFSELLNDRLRVIQLRNRALSRAQSHYSWEGVTRQYQDLFSRVSRSSKRA